MSNFTVKAALGFIARLLLILPLATILVYSGEYSQWVKNISIFVIVLLGAASVLYWAIMAVVPAQYAVKTDIKVIEFNLWKPQIVLVYVSATLTFALAIAYAGSTFYVSAIVLLLYSTATYAWPHYVRRIDAASKEHMMNQLMDKS